MPWRMEGVGIKLHANQISSLSEVRSFMLYPCNP